MPLVAVHQRQGFQGKHRPDPRRPRLRPDLRSGLQRRHSLRHTPALQEVETPEPEGGPRRRSRGGGGGGDSCAGLLRGGEAEGGGDGVHHLLVGVRDWGEN